MKNIYFSDYDGRNKPSVEQRMRALYPSATDSESGSDCDWEEQGSGYSEEEDFFWLDDISDWDDDESATESN